MRAASRVALYGLLLAALFAASLVLGDLLIPASWVEGWSSATSPGH
ncbi:hypothetical protein [Brachybacterium vulturis]|nr:hypothetical protein [Brachybacterium vulturis]